jgi:hypothetical protein
MLPTAAHITLAIQLRTRLLSLLSTQAVGTRMAQAQAHVEEISTKIPATRATAASGCPRKAVK